MQFSHFGEAGAESVTVIHNGQVKIAATGHPYFDKILEGARAGDESVMDLFDLTAPVARKLEPLTDRITVANGNVYFDGDLIDNTLTQQILRFIEQGVEDWKPLASFYEKLMTNLNEHTREQLYGWLEHNSFVLTPEGNFLAYKGVKKDANGKLVSVKSGTAFVNNEEVRGNIPNEVGSVISMARNDVEHNPGVGCSTGLHAGTYDYAKGWAQDALLLVEIDPRDVVSVPTDCSAQKVRVSKYIVREVIDKPVEDAVRGYSVDDDDDLDEDYNPYYNEYEYDDNDF